MWMRYRGDSDAIICVANWPESRQHVWHTLLRARAIENQCYVIGCNRVGDDPNCHYVGHSAIIDSRGKAIAEDMTERQTTVSAEIDIDELNCFRERFGVLADRDRFVFEHYAVGVRRQPYLRKARKHEPEVRRQFQWRGDQIT